MGQTDFDAVVVGSGPNGLSVAITMQQAGLFMCGYHAARVALRDDFGLAIQ